METKYISDSVQFIPPFEACLYGPTPSPVWIIIDSRGQRVCQFASTTPESGDVPEIVKTMVTALNQTTEDDVASDAEIATARSMYGSDEINIDDGAQASRGNDGTWVQAWVLIPCFEPEFTINDIEAVLACHGYVVSDTNAQELFNSLVEECLTIGYVARDPKRKAEVVWSEIEDAFIAKGILTGDKIFLLPQGESSPF